MPEKTTAQARPQPSEQEGDGAQSGAPQQGTVPAAGASGERPTAAPMPALGPSLPPFAVAKLEDEAQPDAALQDLAWSGDGSVLAGVFVDGGVGLWDTHSWSLRRRVEHPAGRQQQVALSGDGGRVVVSNGALVHVYDGESGAELSSLEHEGPVLALASSADAELIITGGADGLRTWSGAGEARARLEQGEAQVEQLRLSADGKHLASLWSDERVRVVDPRKRKLRVTRSFGEALEQVDRIALSQDGARLALRTSDTMATVYELGGEVLTDRLPYPRVFDLDQGGNLMLATATLDGGREVVQLVDVHAREAVRDFGGYAGTLHTARFAPDGLLFATAGSEAGALIFAAP